MLRGGVRTLENYVGEVAAAAEQHARSSGIRTTLGQRVCPDDSSSLIAPATGNITGSAQQPETIETELNVGGGDSCSDDGGSSCTGYYDSQGSGSEWHEEDEGEDGESGREGASGADEGSGGGQRTADEVQFSGVGLGDDGAADRGGGETVAWAMELLGLKLDCLAAVEALKAVLQLGCGRCGATAAVTLASDAVAEGSGGGGGGGGGTGSRRVASSVCPSCHQSWEVEVRPKLVHEASNVLMVIKPRGCVPLDLLPSLFAGQCAQCDAVMSLRGVQLGVACERSCSGCHHQLGLYVAGVAFVPRGRPAGAGLGDRGGGVTTSTSRAARAALARQQGGAGAAPLVVSE